MLMRDILSPIATVGALVVISSSSLTAAPATSAAATIQPVLAVNTLIDKSNVGGKTAGSYLHLIRSKKQRRARRARGIARKAERRRVRRAKRKFRNRNRRLRNHYYGRRHRYSRRHHYGRRHRGASVAAGIAGLIIGGAIAASQRNYSSRWDRCDAAYRTFRWSDGTYIPYVGSPRVLCPYLRR